MKKLISLLLVLCMVACGFASCGGDTTGTPPPVSPTNVFSAKELYSAIPAGESGAADYDLKASFRDDTYWYYIYYLGRVSGIPLSNLSMNSFCYEGNVEVTNTFTTVEMTNEEVAKAFEKANTKIDDWSQETALSCEESFTTTTSVNASVGASVGIKFFEVGAEVGAESTVSNTVTVGLQKNFGISSSNQNTLVQYKENVKGQAITTERSISFRFIPGETKAGYYSYATLGTADVFGLVVYDPVNDAVGITSISEWVALSEKLVYSETDVFESPSTDKLTIDKKLLEFSEPETIYGTSTDIDPIPGNEIVEIDFRKLYSAGEGFVPAACDILYNAQTGIFTAKGAHDNKAVQKYVFKGYYQTQNEDGDTSKIIIDNFTIQVDSERDIELVFENVSFRGAAGLPAIRLNPDKNQNITVTLTINGESLLMGSDGLDGTSNSKDGKNGAAAIDFSAGENSKLVIQGMRKLTLNGGNGGDGLDAANGKSSASSTSNGIAGGNGGNGASAIIAPELQITSTGLILAYSGDGGRGGHGGNGGSLTGNDYTGVPTCGHGGKGGNGGDSAKVIVATKLDIATNIQAYVGNGGDAGKGGNGGNGYFDLVHWCDGGNGANGGDGGDSYETAIEADTVIGSYNELGGTAGAYGEKGTAGKGNGNNFWSAVEDRYGSAGKNGTAGTLLP